MAWKWAVSSRLLPGQASEPPSPQRQQRREITGAPQGPDPLIQPSPEPGFSAECTSTHVHTPRHAPPPHPHCTPRIEEPSCEGSLVAPCSPPTIRKVWGTLAACKEGPLGHVSSPIPGRAGPPTPGHGPPTRQHPAQGQVHAPRRERPHPSRQACTLLLVSVHSAQLGRPVAASSFPRAAGERRQLIWPQAPTKVGYRGEGCTARPCTLITSPRDPCWSSLDSLAGIRGPHT